jgi:hypothetical protein
MEHKQPPKDKAEDSDKEFKKSREYKKFKALLKKVVKAPPMRKSNAQKITGDGAAPL